MIRRGMQLRRAQRPHVSHTSPAAAPADHWAAAGVCGHLGPSAQRRRHSQRHHGAVTAIATAACAAALVAAHRRRPCRVVAKRPRQPVHHRAGAGASPAMGPATRGRRRRHRCRRPRVPYGPVHSCCGAVNPRDAASSYRRHRRRARRRHRSRGRASSGERRRRPRGCRLRRDHRGWSGVARPTAASPRDSLLAVAVLLPSLRGGRRCDATRTRQ